MKDADALGEAVRATWLRIATSIDGFQERVGTHGGFAISRRSSLWADDQATSPFTTSHAAQTALNAGVDHLHALKTLIVDAQRLHVTAPYSLARGALENLAASYWILAPAARADRVEHTLRWFAQDAADGRRAVRSVSPAHAHRLDIRLRDVEVLGKGRNVDRHRIRQGYSSTEAVSYANDAVAVPGGILFAWRLCSGFAHGRSWAQLGVLDKVEVGGADRNHIDVRLTNSLDKVLLPARAAIDLLEATASLFTFRSSPPFE